jgi:DNA repair ATPase RecN
MADKRAFLEKGEAEIAKLRDQLYGQSKKLSEARRTTAKALERAVLDELAQLGMEKSAFEFRFAPLRIRSARIFRKTV